MVLVVRDGYLSRDYKNKQTFRRKAAQWTQEGLWRKERNGPVQFDASPLSLLQHLSVTLLSVPEGVNDTGADRGDEINSLIHPFTMWKPV